MSRIKKKYLIFLIVLLLLIDIVGGLGWYIVNKSDYFKKAKKPNVILISIDTLRPDHLKTYGYPKNTSPNITAWAKENAYIMQNAYTSVPITYPSFTALMTGISPFETHIYNNGMVGKDENNKFVIFPNPGFNSIPQTAPTIASTLRSKGYTTASFIENYALRNDGTNLSQGFDTYQVAGESRDTTNVTDKALKWMQTFGQSDTPFFLWVHFLDPHETFTPQKENACRFSLSYCRIINQRGIEELAKDAKVQSGCHLTPLSRDQIGIQETLYDGEIYQTDNSVGKLLSFIKKNDLDKNSIVILYSDHGEGFDHNYYFAHPNVLYESTVKIMMMISLPGIKAGGKKIVTPVTNADVYPTLMSLLGLSSQKNTASFAPLLAKDNKEGKDPSPRTPIFYIDQNASKFAVRKGDYKYIYTIAERSNKCLAQQTEELYNINSDPRETKNLATQMSSVKESLKSLLLEHLEKTKIVPTENPEPTGIRPSTKQEEEVLKSIRDLGY